MIYDDTTGTVIDPAVEESMKSLEDDVLLGFTLDLSLLNQEEERHPVSTNTGFPSAVDSVSTLDKHAAKACSSSALVAPSVTAKVASKTAAKDDDASLLSSTSGITIETIHTIETRLETLQTQVEKTDSRFNELMEFLRQGNGQAQVAPVNVQKTDQQSGTSSNPVTLDAGEDNSVSGEVP